MPPTDQADERTEATDQPAPPLTPAYPVAIAMGTEVRDAAGAVLGRVAAAWPAYLLVEPEPGGPAGYWVPVEAVAGAAEGTLVVGVTRAEAERLGWSERPEGGPDRPR